MLLNARRVEPLPDRYIHSRLEVTGEDGVETRQVEHFWYVRIFCHVDHISSCASMTMTRNLALSVYTVLSIGINFLTEFGHPEYDRYNTWPDHGVPKQNGRVYCDDVLGMLNAVNEAQDTRAPDAMVSLFYCCCDHCTPVLPAALPFVLPFLHTLYKSTLDKRYLDVERR